MKDKRINIEGSPESKMIQLMRKYGRNKDVTIEIGTVVSPLPNLSIKLNSDELTLDRGELIVSGTLLNQNPQAGASVIVLGDDDSDAYFVIDTAH